VLYDGTPASQQRQTSFKDFEFATATTKASKSRAAAKGFGGGATGSKQPQGQQPAAGAAGAQQQQRVSVEMTQGRFESIVNYNAWGSEISDIGAAPARGEKFSSFVGGRSGRTARDDAGHGACPGWRGEGVNNHSGACESQHTRTNCMPPPRV
jgi:hypothetical protein